MEQQIMNQQQHSATTFGSPATPNQDEERRVEMIGKGWSSERVAPSKSKNRGRCRNVASSTVALFPFSSGRTLPSKWDDAERWICSPVFGHEGGYSSSSQLVQSERRAMSKSGPLGPQTLGSYGNYSPVLPVGSMTAADSPLMGPSDGYGAHGLGGRRHSCPGNEQDLASTREWLKLLHHPRGAESQDTDDDDDAESDGANADGNRVRRVASRRDMGTQMLPSEDSGSGTTPSYDRSPPPAPGMEEEMVKDVKVDKEDALPIRRSVNGFPKSLSIPSSSSHDYNPPDSISQPRSQLPISNSKFQTTEQTMIDDWENLQRGKADAAIQKLEMKLEQKRSSEMEKIMKKLKRAELKAETMRSSLCDTESHQGRKTRQRIARLYRRFRMSAIANCLACR